MTTNNQNLSTADDKPKERRVKFRVTERTWNNLEIIANNAGLKSPHDYARKLVLDTQIKNDDLVEINTLLAQSIELLTSINTTLITQLDYLPDDIIELNTKLDKVVKKQTKLIRKLK